MLSRLTWLPCAATPAAPTGGIPGRLLSECAALVFLRFVHAIPAHVPCVRQALARNGKLEVMLRDVGAL